jgi:hypothetical protein
VSGYGGMGNLQREEVADLLLISPVYFVSKPKKRDKPHFRHAL